MGDYIVVVDGQRGPQGPQGPMGDVTPAATAAKVAAEAAASTINGFIDGSATAKTADIITKGGPVVDIRAYGAHSITETGYSDFDSTAAIYAAQAANKYCYVPSGSYKVSTYKADGLWGPGKLLFWGVHEVVLPKSPRDAGRAQTILAKFARSSFMGGTIGLVGDSISEGYYTSSIETTWFNKLQKMLNIGATGGITNDCEITNFGNPSKYGLTYSGTYAVGSSGPVKQSLVLQDGAAVTFTGKHKYIAAVYEQRTDGGNLVMKRNGTAFKTVNTNGAAAHDVSTLTVNTGGGTESDTFTIIASGGVVELTGVWKLNQTVVPALFFSRLALSAQSTQLFSQDAVLQSTISHLKSINAATKNIVFCAICVNNANTDVPTAGTTPEVYGQQLGKMFARWLNAGCYVIAVGGIYPSITTYPTVHNNYPAIVATQKQVCEQYGVPLISMDQVDWQNAYNGSLLQDGLHPNDAGNEVMLELITEFLASPAFDPTGNSDNKITRKYTPTLFWYNTSNGAVTAGPAVGTADARYWLNGPLCKVQANISNISAATNSSNQLLCVSLPQVANTEGIRVTGSIGYATGIIGSARGKMWTLECIPGKNLAVLRTIDPASGNYDEVASISAGAVLDIAIEYLTQE